MPKRFTKVYQYDILYLQGSTKVLKVEHMKQLTKLEVVGWYVNKMSAPLVNASVNAEYKYEVVKETEKAVQLSIFNPNKLIQSEWLVWFPKSVIVNLNEVLA